MPAPIRPDSDASPFIHPAERIEPSLPVGDDPRAIAEEMFRHLVIRCLPAMQCPARGPSRRYLNAWAVRMAATVYVTSPELFLGLPISAVARQLGLSRVGLKVRIAEIREELASRASARAPIENARTPIPKTGIVKNRGSFPRPPASRGSARGRS